MLSMPDALATLLEESPPHQRGRQQEEAHALAQRVWATLLAVCVLRSLPYSMLALPAGDGPVEDDVTVVDRAESWLWQLAQRSAKLAAALPALRECAEDHVEAWEREQALTISATIQGNARSNRLRSRADLRRVGAFVLLKLWRTQARARAGRGVLFSIHVRRLLDAVSMMSRQPARNNPSPRAIRYSPLLQIHTIHRSCAHAVVHESLAAAVSNPAARRSFVRSGCCFACMGSKELRWCGDRDGRTGFPPRFERFLLCGSHD